DGHTPVKCPRGLREGEILLEPHRRFYRFSGNPDSWFSGYADSRVAGYPVSCCSSLMSSAKLIGWSRCRIRCALRANFPWSFSVMMVTFKSLQEFIDQLAKLHGRPSVWLV